VGRATLSQEEIQRALHASRVIPLGVSNPHGPLGLDQLAAVAPLTGAVAVVEQFVASLPNA
jgi:hypothetical protein